VTAETASTPSLAHLQREAREIIERVDREAEELRQQLARGVRERVPPAGLLLRTAAALGACGINHRAMLAALREINQDCFPTLDGDELEEIAVAFTCDSNGEAA
jgi:hypothetical protein